MRTKALILFLMTILSSCSTLTGSNVIATQHGQFSYITRGEGKPLVIFEAGLGDGMRSWSKVFRHIKKHTKVFAYDRAGYGQSTSRNISRDGMTIIKELRSLLLSLKLNPPYVLVGHSLGGSYMELYARTFPDEVTGVIFVDSRHADFVQRCESAKANMCHLPKSLKILANKAAKQELTAESLTHAKIKASPTFPKIPIVVITGMKKTTEGKVFQEVWLDTQKELTRLSPMATHIICENCGDYVHHDDIDSVTSAILWILDKSKTLDNSSG